MLDLDLEIYKVVIELLLSVDVLVERFMFGLVNEY